jgi:phosphoglycerate dehydrogenase-like enzyme
MAEIGRAFKMNIIAWSENLSEERCRAGGAAHVSREDLFRRADFLSVHLQLSERTRGLIGAPELALMKPTAFLINTSRGPIVEEAALVAALREKRIAGAGIDVFDTEPLPIDHPLRRLDNVLLTPHLGYVTEQNYRTFFAGTVEDIRAFLDGKPLRTLG